MKGVLFGLLFVVGCVIGESENETTAIESAFGNIVCRGMNSFLRGCSVVVPRSQWTNSFNEYAQRNNITQTGATVQYFPAQGELNHFGKVVTIIGPHVSTAHLSSIREERQWLHNPSVAPFTARLDQYFLNRGVSVLYIGFGHRDNSQQPVSQRVYAAKEAINIFRQIRRQAMWSYEWPKTSLVGISLGGVVGKIVLNEVEAESSHDVGTFITVDSPHWGAYTPLGLQKIPLFLESAFRDADRNLRGGFFDSLFVGFLDVLGLLDANQAEEPIQQAREYLYSSLKSPIGQDILITNMAFPNGVSPSIDYIRSYGSSLPQSTDQNIAVVSGSVTGQPLVLGESFFNFQTPELPTSQGQLQLRMASEIPSTENPSYFDAEFRYREPLYSSDTEFYSRNNLASEHRINHLERAPCSYQEKLVRQLLGRLGPQFASRWSGFELTANEMKACTIPSYSAMAITSFDAPLRSPFDRVIGDSTNKPHLAVSENMGDEILDVLNEHYSAIETEMAGYCMIPAWLPMGVFNVDGQDYYSNGENAYCECFNQTTAGYSMCSTPSGMDFHNTCGIECESLCRPKTPIDEGTFNVGDETFYSNGQNQYCRCSNQFETERDYCDFPVGQSAPGGQCAQACAR